MMGIFPYQAPRLLNLMTSSLPVAGRRRAMERPAAAWCMAISKQSPESTCTGKRLCPKPATALEAFQSTQGTRAANAADETYKEMNVSCD